MADPQMPVQPAARPAQVAQPAQAVKYSSSTFTNVLLGLHVYSKGVFMVNTITS